LLAVDRAGLQPHFENFERGFHSLSPGDVVLIVV
jgi:hypothetical protein